MAKIADTLTIRVSGVKEIVTPRNAKEATNLVALASRTVMPSSQAQSKRIKNAKR